MGATAENKNAWQTIGRNWKIIRSTTETGDCIDLVIIGDSEASFTEVRQFLPQLALEFIYAVSDAVNYSKSGAKVRGTYDRFHQFQSEHGNARIKNVIVDVGTNHLSKDDQGNVARKICKLMPFLHSELPDALIFYSGFLRKLDRR